MTDEMGDSRPALLVTCRDGRHPTRAALRRALPGARVRTTAFRDVLRVDAAGDPVALAAQACRVSGAALGRVTAVLEEVPSDRAALLDAAARVGVGQIRPGESFAFRLHKRGPHGYAESTPELEAAAGAAIWAALERRDGVPPRVDLTRPDVAVNAEVLGPTTLVGVVRAAWKQEEHPPDATDP